MKQDIDVTKYVGSQIKKYRRLRNLTQKQLGEKIGVKHNTISSYESGTNEAEQDILFAITEILNISINDLFPPVKSDSLNNLTDGTLEQPTNFSLYEKAQEHNLSELEIEIMKAYMELEPDVREAVLNLAKTLIFNPSKKNVDNTEEAASVVEDNIEAELESYRRELEAEKKAPTLSASQRRETS